ncbi:MAG TPA: helix-turn-helix transcriptional regulator [Solirubrobacteraceae bacterium]|nr:helix-turn-helix transcriptional regulator [Solirubrobacteraceae bacterium]
MTEPALNTELLVSRRLELGYSHRDMGRLVGVSGTTIRGVEDARSHARVTLDFLFRFAEALQLPAGALLHDECQGASSEQAHAGDERSGISEDARRVSQLLLAVGKGVPPAALARATGLNLKRVKAAVDELQRATDAGEALLRVTINNSRVALLPRDDAVSKEEMIALERQVLAVDELKHPAARMLSAVVHGEIDSDREQNMRRGDRPHLQSLLKRGLIERARGGRLSLSGEVSFSLGLVTASAAKLRHPGRSGR